VPPAEASVLARQAEGVPKVHVAEAAVEMLADEKNTLIVPARIEARAMVSRAELDEAKADRLTSSDLRRSRSTLAE
jgi:hypothetical protein